MHTNSFQAAARLRAAFFITLLLGLPLTVEAQYTRMDQLMRQVSQMRGEIQYLRSQVSNQQAVAVAPNNQAILSSFELRLSALENEIRTLTGYVEELRFLVIQDRTRRDQVEIAFEQRLKQLEQGGSAQGSMAQASVVVPSLTNPATMPASFTVQGGTAQTDIDLDALTAAVSTQSFENILAAAQPPTQSVLTEEQPSNNRVAALPPLQAPATQMPKTPEDLYQYARGLLKKGQYDDGIEELKVFLEDHSDHERAGEASYWLGETYYKQSQYTKAAIQFADGYRRYSKSAKAPDHLLKLALSLKKLKRRSEACGSFALIKNRYRKSHPKIYKRARRESDLFGCRL